MLGLTNELLPLAYEYVWGVGLITKDIFLYFFLLLSTQYISNDYKITSFHGFRKVVFISLDC